MNLSLEQIFGVGAAQDANTLIIQKSNLVGLSVLPANKPTSLLAAIINTVNLQFEGTLTDQNGVSIANKDGTPVTYDNSNYWENISVKYWGTTFPTGFYQKIFLFNQYIAYTPS